MRAFATACDSPVTAACKVSAFPPSSQSCYCRYCYSLHAQCAAMICME